MSETQKAKGKGLARVFRDCFSRKRTRTDNPSPTLDNLRIQLGLGTGARHLLTDVSSRSSDPPPTHIYRDSDGPVKGAYQMPCLLQFQSTIGVIRRGRVWFWKPTPVLDPRTNVKNHAHSLSEDSWVHSLEDAGPLGDDASNIDAFSLYRTGAMLGIPSLVNWVSTRLIVEKMLHRSSSVALLDSAKYAQLMQGNWSNLTKKGGCRCSRCACAAPSVLLFSLADDIKDHVLENVARQTLVASFGLGWCTSEFSSLPIDIAESVLQDLLKMITPQNSLSLLFAVEEALSPLNPYQMSSAIRKLLMIARVTIEDMVCEDPQFCFDSSPEWRGILDGIGPTCGEPSPRDKTRMKWIFDTISRARPVIVSQDQLSDGDGDGDDCNSVGYLLEELKIFSQDKIVHILAEFVRPVEEIDPTASNPESSELDDTNNENLIVQSVNTLDTSPSLPPINLKSWTASPRTRITQRPKGPSAIRKPFCPSTLGSAQDRLTESIIYSRASSYTLSTDYGLFYTRQWLSPSPSMFERTLPNSSTTSSPSFRVVRRLPVTVTSRSFIDSAQPKFSIRARTMSVMSTRITNSNSDRADVGSCVLPVVQPPPTTHSIVQVGNNPGPVSDSYTDGHRSETVSAQARQTLATFSDLLPSPVSESHEPNDKERDSELEIPPAYSQHAQRHVLLSDLVVVQSDNGVSEVKIGETDDSKRIIEEIYGPRSRSRTTGRQDAVGNGVDVLPGYEVEEYHSSLEDENDDERPWVTDLDGSIGIVLPFQINEPQPSGSGNGNNDIDTNDGSSRGMHKVRITQQTMLEQENMKLKATINMLEAALIQKDVNLKLANERLEGYRGQARKEKGEMFKRNMDALMNDITSMFVESVEPASGDMVQGDRLRRPVPRGLDPQLDPKQPGGSGMEKIDEEDDDVYEPEATLVQVPELVKVFEPPAQVEEVDGNEAYEPEATLVQDSSSSIYTFGKHEALDAYEPEATLVVVQEPSSLKDPSTCKKVRFESGTMLMGDLEPELGKLKGEIGRMEENLAASRSSGYMRHPSKKMAVEEGLEVGSSTTGFSRISSRPPSRRVLDDPKIGNGSLVFDQGPVIPLESSMHSSCKAGEEHEIRGELEKLLYHLDQFENRLHAQKDTYQERESESYRGKVRGIAEEEVTDKSTIYERAMKKNLVDKLENTIWRVKEERERVLDAWYHRSDHLRTTSGSGSGPNLTAQRHAEVQLKALEQVLVTALNLRRSPRKRARLFTRWRDDLGREALEVGGSRFNTGTRWRYMGGQSVY